MKYNIFCSLLLGFCFALVSCNSSYNMMKDSGGSNEVISEETKINSYLNCKLCPSCNQDYRYFYVCSHGAILMMCNECYATYDVAYEAGLRLEKDKHQIEMYECFDKKSRLATRDDLQEAGLIDFVNKLGLLDEEDNEE